MIFKPILGLLLTADPGCDKLSFTSSVLFEMYLVADLSKHMDGAILVGLRHLGVRKCSDIGIESRRRLEPRRWLKPRRRLDTVALGGLLNEPACKGRSAEGLLTVYRRVSLA